MNYKGKFIQNNKFILIFSNEKFFEPSIKIEQHILYPNNMITEIQFVPNFFQFSKKRIDYNANLNNIKKEFLNFNYKNAKGEYIFMMDRSFSLGGKFINQIKMAAYKFIDLLPNDSYFNIISFGSFNELLFEESIKYNLENAEFAKKKVKLIK